MLVNQFRHIKENFPASAFGATDGGERGEPPVSGQGSPGRATAPQRGAQESGRRGKPGSLPDPRCLLRQTSFRRAPAEVWSLEMESPGSRGPLGPGSPAWSVGGPPQLMPHYSLPATCPHTCHLGTQAALRGGVSLSSAPIPHTR